jgi:hypothetical protein
LVALTDLTVGEKAFIRVFNEAIQPIQNEMANGLSPFVAMAREYYRYYKETIDPAGLSTFSGLMCHLVYLVRLSSPPRTHIARAVA